MSFDSYYPRVRHVHADDKVYVEAFWEHLGHDPAYKGAYTEAGEMIGASQSPSTSKAASAPKPGSSGEPQAQVCIADLGRIDGRH